jgi:hypothetical protein
MARSIKPSTAPDGYLAISPITCREPVGDGADDDVDAGAQDTTQAGLPPGFTQRLRDAVASYQVARPERTEPLEEALLWMFLAQQRDATLLPAVLAILCPGSSA